MQNYIKEEDKDFKKLVCYGTFFCVIALLLQGPVPFILPDSVIIISLGTLVAGIGGALINNNCVPCMAEVLTEE